jgi:protein translocase SecG subunit
MSLVFNIAQIVLGALLMTTVLLQQKGSGLGSAFGSEGNIYQTRRGAEKFIFRSTIVLAIVFFGLAIARILLKQ